MESSLLINLFAKTREQNYFLEQKIVEIAGVKNALYIIHYTLYIFEIPHVKKKIISRQEILANVRRYGL